MPSNEDETGAATASAAHDNSESNGVNKHTSQEEQLSKADSNIPPATTDHNSAALSTSAPPAPPAAAASADTSSAASLDTSTTPSAATTATTSSTSPPPPAPFPSDAALLSHLQSYLSTADFNVVTTKTIIAHLQAHFQQDMSSRKAMIKHAINTFVQNPTQPTLSPHNGSDQQAEGGTEAEAAAAEEDGPEEQAEETQEESDRRIAQELAEEDRRPRRSAAADSIKRAEKRKLKAAATSAHSNADSTPSKKAKKSTKPPTLYSLSPALSSFLPGQPSHASWGDVVKQLWAYFREKGLQDEKNKKRILLDAGLQSVFGKERKTVDAFKMNTLLTKHMKKQSEIVGE